jgi:two-component system sensor kinase FixL
MDRSTRQTEVATEICGCLMIDHKARILSFDAGCEQLFGFSCAEVMGQNVSLLMPPIQAHEHDGYLTRYLCGMSSGFIGKKSRVIARHSNGRLFPTWLTVQTTQDDEQPGFIGHFSARRTR